MIEFKVKINSDNAISRENLTHIMQTSIDKFNELYDVENKNYDEILETESNFGDYDFKYIFLNLKIGSLETITCSVDIVTGELFSMLQVCEIIAERKDIDLKIGRIKMFEYLRLFGILNQNNLPLEKFLTTGNNFAIKKDVINGKTYSVTYVTKKGIDFIVSVFKDRNIIL